MKRSFVHIPSWIFAALTLCVLGLTPLSASGAQEMGGAMRQESAVHTGPGDDRINLQSLIEELVARSPEMKAARERWEAAKAVVPQAQTLPDPKLQFGYQRMPMIEPLQGAMYGIGQEIPFPGKLRLKGEVAQREADRIEQDYLAIRLRL
ncbi:MAG: TolC family protein, partial [Nitrospira sp.]|nr:TolC family protein [Nitrospira sp.]